MGKILDNYLSGKTAEEPLLDKIHKEYNFTYGTPCPKANSIQVMGQDRYYKYLDARSGNLLNCDLECMSIIDLIKFAFYIVNGRNKSPEPLSFEK